MYQHFALYYDQIFPVNPNTYEQLKRWMTKNKKAIDLGCATGHLVHFMHLQEMQATGVDLDGKMIEVARSNYPLLTYINMDMVDYLDGQKDIQLMTCLGNTIPHLNNDQIHRFFEEVSKALASDGLLIIQLLNYDKILRDLPEELPVIERGGITFHRYYRYFQDHLIFKTRLHISQHETEGSTILYPYTKDELKKIIQDHGLKASCYQNLNRDSWSIEASHQTWFITH